MLSNIFHFFSVAVSLSFVRSCQGSATHPISASDEEPTASIRTPFGKVVGNHDKNGCDEWLGIPYAKPPIGELRFVDTVPWKQPYENGWWDATRPSAFCAQKSGGSEDCLYLNLWRPTLPVTSDDDESWSPRLPAMIFIHGGAFTSGSALNEAPGTLPDSLGEYNGCNLAREQNVIVASMNYRLGPFGFAAFYDEGTGRASANFGLQDQRAAIQWLRNHVTSFGGDPEAITIFGESSGAMSVLAHVASPKSRDLFRAAISESGYPIALSWEQGLEVTRQFAKKAGCLDDGKTTSMRACLRAKRTKQLIQAAGDSVKPLKFLVQTGWNPVVDGSELPEHPMKALSNDGKDMGPSVPLLIGTNTNEANLFVYSNYRFGMPFRQFGKWLQSFTTNHNVETKFDSMQMDEAKILYEDITDERSRAGAIGTDGSFLCGTQAVARAYRRAPVFVYRFNHRPKCVAAQLLAPGVCHTLELMFVFNNPQDLYCRFDTVDEAVGVRMRTMWANFAKSLNPSLGSLNATAFPHYNVGQHKNVILQGGGDTIESNYRASYCDFWHDKLFDKLADSKMGPGVDSIGQSIGRRE